MSTTAATRSPSSPCLRSQAQKIAWIVRSSALPILAASACTNKASIRRDRLDDLVLDALGSRLMQPDLVAAFVKNFIAEWNRQQAGEAADRDTEERELAQVERKLTGLCDAIADGLRAPGLKKKLHELETRKTALQQLLPRRYRACTPTWPRSIANGWRSCGTR